MKLDVVEDLTVRTPARVVLFGEHQDYLGLPVIPAAIDLYMTIKGRIRSGTQFKVELPDLGKQDVFSTEKIRYLGDRDRDYLRAGVKILLEEDIIPKGKGVISLITSQIPIQAGVSSSSALNVGWIKLLSELFGHPLNPKELTKLAHKSEVLEFNEPGGMQDHMAISYGYINFEEFDPVRCTKLLDDLPGLVVGNSKERKDTLNTLACIKSSVNKALKVLDKSKVSEVEIEEVNRLNTNIVDNFSLRALKAAVINHKITRKAYDEFRKKSFDPNFIGKLMDDHHASLRDDLGISTTKIEDMIHHALNAGAIGCKITGSGNGGCMIAYCPDRELEVKEAIEKTGNEAFIVKVVKGASVV